MRKVFRVFLICMLLGVCVSLSFAQTKKTIILVRHAEKDAAQADMSGDPDLSVAGNERARRLVDKIGKYKPGVVYSSDTKRTRATAKPMADHRHLQIQIYDPRKADDLVKQIMDSKTKRFLIVGHSNTIPSLANLLGKKEIFKDLDDNEYGVIWVIKIRKGRIYKTEILSY